MATYAMLTDKDVYITDIVTDDITTTILLLAIAMTKVDGNHRISTVAETGNGHLQIYGLSRVDINFKFIKKEDK